jgi:hypothetical protein
MSDYCPSTFADQYQSQQSQWGVDPRWASKQEAKNGARTDKDGKGREDGWSFGFAVGHEDEYSIQQHEEDTEPRRRV